MTTFQFIWALVTISLALYLYNFKINRIEIRSLPKRYFLPIFLLMFSAILVPVSGWQVEICTIWATQGKLTFEFPFYLGGEFNVYVARDLWYAINAVAYIMGIAGGYLCGKY